MRSHAMPWKDSSSACEQRMFIATWLRGEETVSQLCRRFQISRKTGYKRINRFRECGDEGLGDLSRAPRRHPNATSSVVARQLIEVKQAHPTWGPKKVVAWLRAEVPQLCWPASSTAGEILNRAGLVKRRHRRRRTSPWSQPFTEAIDANDVWCMDFKGWFRTGDGMRIDPLTVQDAASRYLLACSGLTRPTGPQVRRALQGVFREYGLPWTIRTDNGSPFASVGLGGLSALSVWWIKLGITPERIEPGHPEQNGRLERFHRTLKEDTANPPKPGRMSQQRAFDTFRASYNEQRPHEALGQQPPRRVYRPSYREHPNRVQSPEYGHGVMVRRVRTNGQIKWKGSLVYLSESLRGEPVGLVQLNDRYWRIQHGPLSIGMLDEHTGKVLNTSTKVLPMCPV